MHWLIRLARPNGPGARVVMAALLCTGCAPPSEATPPTSAPIRTPPPTAEESPASGGPSISLQNQPEPASSPDDSLDEVRTVALDVPGFLPAVLVVPPGNETRPLVAAAHGAGGAPEWECEYWKRLTSGKAFVACLRGTAMGGGSFYFKHHHALREELVAVMDAARARFPRIAPSAGIYAGFSQGASMGSHVVARLGAQFSYTVLIEGFEQWDAVLSRTYARGGGKAVLMVCGTTACANKAQNSVRAIENAGLKARAHHAVGTGHTPLGGVLPLVERDLPWLVADDPLWQ